MVMSYNKIFKNILGNTQIFINFRLTLTRLDALNAYNMASAISFDCNVALSSTASKLNVVVMVVLTNPWLIL